MSDPLGRRSFLGSLASFAGIAAVGPGAAQAAARREGPFETAAGSGEWDFSWLDTLKGKHRQVFAAGAAGPVSMAVVTNWLDGHDEVFGLKPPAVNAIVGISVRAFPINCSDALWSKYELGRRFEIKDPATGEWATRNLFLDQVPEYVGWKVVGVRPLQARGVIFWQCNNALTGHANRFAREMQLDPKKVHDELVAGLNPGVKLVPAHTMALGLAQEHGCTYEQIG
ncbi:MAG TPA: hypothetical protein VL383_00250 [Gemmatimonadaceae bacterium]|nr:hypothetical protein [Gemmatimonadaceae bacterium]